MTRRITQGPRAISCATLAAGLTLALAAPTVAPAMPEPDGIAPPRRIEEGTRAGAADRTEFLPLPDLIPPPQTPSFSSVPGGDVVRAIARYEGTPAPGGRVTLRAAGVMPGAARVQWRQIRGTPVRLEHPDKVDATFTVPATEDPLGFLLVVADSRGIDSTEVSIPTRPIGRSAGLRADAGDDQVGLIGRQVTLNGMRSEPHGRLAYRWIQTGGPVVRFKIEQGFIYSFVPSVPGTYRFALVVAAGGEISEPDEVCVTVGSGVRAGGVAGEGAAPEAMPTQEIARAALKSLGAGREVAESLALAFEETANRMDLYENYSEAFAEMSRRLDPILPEDAPGRNRWIKRLFEPLTGRVVEVMQAEGLDFRRPGSQTATLGARQRAALADQFRLIADGLRTAGTSR